MSQFIQPLESRKLFSVTRADLVANQALLNDLSTAAHANLKSMAAVYVTDTRAIKGVLAGTGKVNAKLLAALVKTEAKANTTLLKAVDALFKPGLKLSKASVATGIALLHKITTRLANVASTEVAALNASPLTPLANLQADIAADPLAADIAALDAANPSNGALSVLTSNLEDDLTAPKAALNSFASQFQTDLATLATDLSGILAG